MAVSDNDSFTSANSDSFYSFSDSEFELPTLRSLLTQKFDNYNKNFNVCHINAQSIPQHYNDLLETFNNQSIHAVLISETWLNPTLPSISYGLPGFILLRNDRIDKRGGGVAVYLRSGIPYKILSASPSQCTGSLEYIFLEIVIGGNKVMLGAIYCPPNSNYLCEFEEALLSVCSDYQHHILMGDFNTNLLSDTPKSRGLRSIIESANFSILPLETTHHNLTTEDTLLDLILVSSEERVACHGQFPAPGFSRHDLLFISYKIKPPKVKPVIVRLRNFARVNVESLQHDASLLDWSDTFNAESIDDKITTFNSNIHKLFDKHAPIREVRLKRVPAPWITENIRKAMSKRDQMFRKFKQNRCELNWAKFKAARNRCNQMVRAAKRRYIHHNIMNSSMADTWKFLRTIGVGKPTCNVDPGIISISDLNLHFSSTSQMEASVKSSTISYLNSMPQSRNCTFNFSPVADEDIKKIIYCIKSMAVGFDDVNRLMITLILDNVTHVITHIINHSLLTGHFPTLWKKAFVIPLPKINNPSSFSHFRPISILPFLSKVLEAIVHKQISCYIFKNNFLSTFQSGFRPGHSTTTALLKVTEDLRTGMENSKLTVLVLIDFSNAFNAVDHDILLAVLCHLGFSSSARDWFSSYLRGRQQAIRVGQIVSDWCSLSAGVPQGGILSPLLFSVFINLITSHIRCSYHLYADDLQIYAQTELAGIDDVIKKLNCDLNSIYYWSDRFGIRVNPSKCQAIVVGSSRRLPKIDMKVLPPIIFNNVTIPYSITVKDLGLVIDNTLTWRPHIYEVGKKVTHTLRCLYRLKNFLPIKTKVMLIQTLVLPILDYADVCYADASQELLNKLDRLLNNCIRFIFGLRKYDHISSYRSQLKWLPLRYRRYFRILCTLFSVLHDPFVPEYLKCKFQYQGDSHDRCLRSAEKSNLHVPLCHTSFLYKSFTSHAVRLWNELPSSVRAATSKASFKRLLWNHFLALQE